MATFVRHPDTNEMLPAEASGRIRPGDELIDISGTNIEGLGGDQATNLIREVRLMGLMRGCEVERVCRVCFLSVCVFFLACNDSRGEGEIVCVALTFAPSPAAADVGRSLCSRSGSRTLVEIAPRSPKPDVLMPQNPVWTICRPCKKRSAVGLSRDALFGFLPSQACFRKPP